MCMGRLDGTYEWGVCMGHVYGAFQKYIKLIQQHHLYDNPQVF